MMMSAPGLGYGSIGERMSGDGVANGDGVPRPGIPDNGPGMVWRRAEGEEGVGSRVRTSGFGNVGKLAVECPLFDTEGPGAPVSSPTRLVVELLLAVALPDWAHRG